MGAQKSFEWIKNNPHTVLQIGLALFPEGEAAEAGMLRAEPANLAEQMTLEEAKSGAGQEIMLGKIKDPRFPQSDWAKMSHTHTNPDGGVTEIHFWQNRHTLERLDYKFKNPPPELEQ